MHSQRLKLTTRGFALALFFYAPYAHSMMSSTIHDIFFVNSKKGLMPKELALLEAAYWQEYACTINAMSLPEEPTSIDDFHQRLKSLHDTIKNIGLVGWISEKLEDELCRHRKIIWQDSLKRWEIFDSNHILTIIEMEYYRQDMINYCLGMQRIIRTISHLD